HVFSLSALLGPWQGLSLTLGTQNEWTRQSGLGTSSVEITLPFAPFVFPVEPPQNIRSELDRSVFSQSVGLRFTKIPFTTLFADARFQEEDAGLFEEEENGLTPFLRNTDTRAELKDFRVGFNTSPWRRVSLNGHYRRYDNETDYNNSQKEIPGYHNEGYPAFFRRRDLLSNEAQTKLALQVTSWLKTSLSYEWLNNDYHTFTDPVTFDLVRNVPADLSPGRGLLAGTYKAHIASLNATLTPWRRLFLSTTLAYQNARTLTAANGSPSVAPYAGDIFSVIVSGNYIVNDKTSLAASYSFSKADFSQDNLASCLPLGITYQQHTLHVGLNRQIGTRKSVGLQYRFYYYDEPTGGGFNNFEAHAVFATLAWRLP